jgi:hypothetical protein
MVTQGRVIMVTQGPQVVQQVDRGEAGIADANDAAVRQPACCLDQDLRICSTRLKDRLPV